MNRTETFLRKAWAFIKKDFHIQSSYRISFLFEWLGILIHAATFYFVAKLFEQNLTPYLKEYQTGYFPFVLIGIAFSGYLSIAIRSFSGNIRREQMMGTLEAMITTPTRLPILIVSLSLWNFIFTSISSFIYLSCGVLFFDVDLSHMNIGATLIILLLTIVSFSCIGIISASFVIVLKKGDPVSWLTDTFARFFGGALFPVIILPKGLRTISYFLPITYSLKALRHSLLQGYGFSMLRFEIGILLAFCIILGPLSLWTFRGAVRKAKNTGSLAHY